MRLTTVTNVSVDGVMQGLGGPEEDRQDGFERAGWALPLFDADAEAFLAGIFERADAFLLGRRTYESFAGSWGAIEEMANSPIGRALNSRPKYLVSATLTEPSWTATTVLSADLAAAVRELK
ncbi:dihydrofolate reductase family protein, partial [Nocardia sp. NPDC003345]